MKNSFKKILKLCISILFICGMFSANIYAQDTRKLPENWYCDNRLKLLPNLRAGTVIKIESVKEAAQSEIIYGFYKRNVEYKTQNLIHLKTIDFLTGKESYETPQFLSVSSEKESARNFKIGDSIIFEVDRLGLNPRGKGTYSYHLEFISPNGYFKTLSEAVDDIEFFKLTKNADRLKSILDFDDGQAIRGGVVNGKARRLVTPHYPASAKKAKIGGIVNVMVLIDETGKIIKAKAFCFENKELAEAAESAARASEFSPTLLSGKPVKVTGVIVYNFVKD